MSKIVGIDLGTSNSAAAVMEGGKATLVPSAEGFTVVGKAFPSYVAFTKDGQLLVGEPARRQAIANPRNTMYAFKRKMGTEFKYQALGKEYTPQQLSAFLLQKIRRDTEAYLGEKITKAVITVPAYFNDNQRQATKDAGSIAGLEVVRIVNEPTAACLAYGVDKKGKSAKIMVFDFGGGTLDVTIMDFGGGIFEVISTAGDTQLGGTDMDNALVNYIASEFKRETGIDIRNDPTAAQRVREAVEKAKIELSTVAETDINLPFISADAAGPKHLTMKLTRAKLESLVEPIVKRCKTPVEKAIVDSKLKASDINKIILVGGPTRMPIVQKFAENFIGIQGERGIDPMECVAIGAAVQAAVLTGEVKDLILLDVTPLSLGVESLGNVVTRLIEKNTTIPVKKSQIFSTAADNQPAVTVHIVQGERPMAKDNVSLGKFNLDGVLPARRGTPQIDVSFDIDANGILNVSAKDLGTNRVQHITVTAPNKLDKAEVEKYINEAEEFAEEDRRRREFADAKNEADSVLYATQKAVEEYGDKVSQEELAAIEQAASELKEALKREDLSAIKSVQEKLLTVSQKLAEMVCKEGGAKAQSGESAERGEAPSGEEIVDVEVVDEDKRKK